MNPQIEISNESFSISISSTVHESMDCIQCEKLTNIEISTDDFYLMIQIWLKEASVEVSFQTEGRNGPVCSIGEIGEITLGA